MTNSPPEDDEKLPETVSFGEIDVSSLAETAREFARQSAADHTQTAYSSDWRHFLSWCRRKGFDALPPSPQVVGLYIADCAAPSSPSAKALSVSTIERRLSGITWNFTQRGFQFDRADRHVSSVLAGIRRTLGRPPDQKEALLANELLSMIDTLGHDLRGLRDRTILLLAYAGGLRRSEVVGLNVRMEDIEEGGHGWIEVLPEGALLRFRSKTGWREVAVGRGSSERSCPVVALERWISFARIERGPVFRPILKDGKTVDVERLSSKHVARLVKHAAEAAGIRGELTSAERGQAFAGHSLRAGLASSADVEERYVQKQLGHASVEMTRRYQRNRDRFKINLTKASGL